MKLIEDMYLYPQKFVRKGNFWQQSKKNQHLQKIIQHGNGCVMEPGGHEIRMPLDHRNQRFNY